MQLDIQKIGYMSPIESFHNQLVCSGNKLQVVCMVKLLRNVLFALKEENVLLEYRE